MICVNSEIEKVYACCIPQLKILYVINKQRDYLNVECSSSCCMLVFGCGSSEWAAILNSLILTYGFK